VPVPRQRPAALTHPRPSIPPTRETESPVLRRVGLLVIEK
jgi:hypothetical protein